MKTYTWEEVICKFRENENLAFEDAQGELILKYDHKCIRFYDRNDGDSKNVERYGLNLDKKFKLIQEPVTFMEAVNSGKRIRYETWEDCEYDDIAVVLKELCADYRSGDTIKKMINGKWYIQED